MASKIGEIKLKVYAFVEFPENKYYRIFFYLKQRNLIDEFRMSSNLDVLKAPRRFLEMQRADKIIFGWAPYHSIIYYSLLLKSLKKDDLVYFTSWPYWNGTRYPNEPHFIQKTLWESFLNGIKAVAVTRKARNGVQRRGAIAYHIPHPIDTESFKPKMKGMTHNERIKVLFVGAIVKRKGVLLLVEAAKRLKEKNIEFWLVGGGRDISNRSMHLHRKIMNATRSLNVKYFGYIEHNKLPNVYNLADIFVLPSYAHARDGWEELFGIVLLEAMSCGLPVISTDCVGPREIVEDGRNGFLIPQRNVDELVEKIKILSDDEKLRRRMGMEGRKKVLREYNVRKIAKEWMDVLNE